MDHLCSLPTDPEKQAAALPGWTSRSEDFLVELLAAMGATCGYSFDKVHLRKAIYVPKGHTDDEMEQRAFRRLMVEILLGRRRFPISTTLQAADEGEEKFGKAYRKGLLDILQGKSDLKITIVAGNEETQH